MNLYASNVIKNLFLFYLQEGQPRGLGSLDMSAVITLPLGASTAKGVTSA
ncbi:Uncharacterised protein [Yersinia enterocolitica]|nr:Uncharacterised protein [Yersinia enterocolitica]CNF58017.1 Uncharacterised protein [Yersinia enterocolitica]CNI96145.1 Uncharacterised protein [Yersinia enterocolitica]